MAGSRDLLIRLLGDSSGMKKALDDADGAVGKHDLSLKNLAGTIGSTYAVAKVVEFGKASVNAASDLSESINAVNVTFGESAGGILKLGEAAATAVGLSNAEFNGLAVQFAGFAQTVAGERGNVVGTMEELTVRVADFASVMNLDVPEAARIFQSALSGETEPIRKFGIDLSAAAVEAYAFSNGIADAGSKLSETEKVQARYGLLMQSTAKVHGDFANTSDGLANQQRILKATFADMTAQIGTALVPVMQEVVGVATTLVEWFSSLDEGTQTWIVRIGMLGGGLVLATRAVNGVLGPLKQFGIIGNTAASGMEGAAGAATGMSSALKGALAGGLILVTGLMAGLASAAKNEQEAMGAAAGAFDEFLRVQGEVASDELYETFRGTTAVMMSVDDALREFTHTNLEAAIALRDSGAVARDNADDQKVLEEAIRDEIAARKLSEQATAAATAEIEANTSATATSTNTISVASAAVQYWTDITGGATTALQENRVGVLKSGSSVSYWTDIVSGATTKLAAHKVGVDNVTIAEAELIDELGNVSSALRTLMGATLSMEDANQALYEGSENLVESVKANGASLDITTEKGRANRDVVKQQVENILAHGAALLETGASQAEATGAIEMGRQALIQQMTQLGLTEAEAKSYVEQLGLTPANIVTSVDLANTERMKTQINDILTRLGPLDDPREADIQAKMNAGDYAGALAKLREIERDRTANVRVTLTGNPTIGGMRMFAKGGVSDGGLAVVGERGPELVELSGGTRVHNATDTRRMLSVPKGVAGVGATGTTIIVNQTVNVAGSLTTEGDLMTRMEILRQEAIRRGALLVPA